MSLFWVRTGNFYEKRIFAADSSMQNEVFFDDTEPSGIIPQIILIRYSDEDFNIDMTIAPKFFSEISSACKQLFSESDLDISARDMHQIRIFFRDPKKYDQLQKQLEQLFENYNKNKINFPSELINEIRQIIAFLKLKPEERNWEVCKHFIPEETIATSHVNPGRKDSQELMDLISDKFSVSKFFDGLVAGEDPNQGEIIGVKLPFKIIVNANYIRRITHNDDVVDVVKALGAYGARFFDRKNGRFFRESAFDIAFTNGDKKILDYFGSLLTSMGKSLSARDLAPVITVDKIIFSYNETCFVFKNNNIIKVKLIPINQLTVAQRKDCYQLFKKYFKDPHGDESHVIDTFNDSFAISENRFVEMIFISNEAGEQLRGINLREAWKSDIVPDHGVVHGIYCYMEPELRRYGLSDLLAFSLPAMLQMLYPKHTFVFIYSPTTYQAYLMLKIAVKLLHAPKYQSPLVKMLIEEFISRVYNGEVEVVHKNMTWGVKEKFPLVSIDAKAKKHKEPLEQFYDEKISAGNYPLVLWHASKQSVDELTKSAKRLGFDFGVYAETQAMFFKNDAEKIMKKPSFSVYPNHNFKEEGELFWKSTHIRSRL